MSKYQKMTKLELLCEIEGLKETIVANNAVIRAREKTIADYTQSVIGSRRLIKVLLADYGLKVNEEIQL